MASPPAAANEARSAGDLGRAAAWTGLAGTLALALGLRLWGITQGLPYAYNSDENAHFLPRAIGMFGHSLNPEYFANPPAFTYLLHLLLAVWFGGASAVGHAYAAHPTEVWLLARSSVAVLGTLAVWLLYATGARLFSRSVGLLAALLQAVAFLPVFYAHLALNDVPTLAPLTLSLLGSAGILRKGRPLDYLIAGIGLGLGCATKYTAGIVLLVLLAAAAAQYIDAPRQWSRVLLGLVLAALAALAAFIAADPYSLLDFSAFHAGIAHQSSLSSEAQGKLGAPKESGILYYLWALSWGFGWVPSLAALGGAVCVCKKQRALGFMLVPAPLVYLAAMGLESRYFGRWLIPITPILCLLGAYFALCCARRLARLGTRLRLNARTAGVCGAIVCAAALCVQGLIYSVHSGLVLSRPYTANLTRAWMLEHIPLGSRIVLEPIAPDNWAFGSHDASVGELWDKYPSLERVTSSDGSIEPTGEVVGIEDYERTLSPALVGYYESLHYCWVITGSTQYGRAYADPHAVPQAIAYYRELERQGSVRYHVSPYTSASKPVAFNFDWSFDYYPLAYQRPGPEMTVFQLHGGGCARHPAAS